ncbi:AAA family ATPase [Candidatus Dojkabacteria bacterium]|nr:AAA family ATPase [Candidatus Dojkabacteria bacterium]
MTNPQNLQTNTGLPENHDSIAEIEKLGQLVSSVKLPQELKERVEQMINRVRRVARLGSYSQEFEIVQKYAEWITKIPWEKYTTDNLDLQNAKQMLDKHHYGLNEIKERILEHLAIIKLRDMNIAAGSRSSTDSQTQHTSDTASTAMMENSVSTAENSSSDEMKRLQGSSGHAPIISFVGVQGIGKTSMAKSIANALGRKFIRISLGAMGNATELRGRPMSVAGAEPGQIVDALVRTGVMNPVILLDEIDKVSSETGLRSDVMAALLEILDPEQNSTFMDHYIDYPIDLSKVIFICTANNLGGITTALLDRLEVIRFSSYTDEEKQVIARDYLLPKVREATGMMEDQLGFSSDVWPLIIRPLGFDAGVRQLERTLTTLARKVAKMIVEGEVKSVQITPENFRQFIPEDIGVYS